MSQLNIRKANLVDIKQLQEISIQTFTETYSAFNTQKNIDLYISDSLSLSQLTYEIKNISSAFYLVFLENSLIGYLKINLPGAQTELIDSKSIEIERIYLIKKQQGKGFGENLIDFVIQIASSEHLYRIWLGVWSKNEKAIDFYKKIGFTEFDKRLFKLGDDEQLDFLMELKIKKTVH
jgi:ribosomal protein S18 acetylase RimI-like enzyme